MASNPFSNVKPALLSLLLLIFLTLGFPVSRGFSFPVIGEIVDHEGAAVGKAHVYPRYVEIMDNDNQFVGKIGVLVESGVARLFAVRQDAKRTLVGYTLATDLSHQGKIMNREDRAIGFYYWTPTYSFIFNKDGKRVGKVKCIAWPRVCAAGVSAYLLGLYAPEETE